MRSAGHFPRLRRAISISSYRTDDQVVTMDTKKCRVTNVWLIRHAESYNNTLYDVIKAKYGDDVSDSVVDDEEVKLRDKDPTLSDRGFRQAEALGAHFYSTYMSGTDVKEVQVYSSPMYRCLLTTKSLISSHPLDKIKVSVVPNLYESGGCFDYIPKGDGTYITQGFPHGRHNASEIVSNFDYDCSLMEDGWYNGDKKETNERFFGRVEEIVGWIWSQHDAVRESANRNIIIVAHGNLISGLINRLLSNSPVNGIVASCNTGVSHLQLFTSIINGVDRKIACTKYINRVDHLDKEIIMGNDIVHDHWIQEYYF